jgi:hypothetical protein
LLVPESPTGDHGVTPREATAVWMRVTLLSFGGPAGQIAVMHRILVEEKRWIGESRFMHALNYCMLLPRTEHFERSSLVTLSRRGGDIVSLQTRNGARTSNIKPRKSCVSRNSSPLTRSCV